MNVIIIVLFSMGVVYAMYSLICLAIEIRKKEKKKCLFEATLLQWVVHGSGVILLIVATFLFYKKESVAWILFLTLACDIVVDFIVRNIQIEK